MTAAVFKKILVPVDGSRYSRDAVRLAAKLAGIHGARLRLLHVLDELVVDQIHKFSGRSAEAVRQELRQNAQAFLEDMERDVLKESVPMELHIAEGIPHEAILKEAASWHAGLIVMGKLGRRGISHIVLGSVTERVIEFSNTPVLVVK